MYQLVCSAKFNLFKDEKQARGSLSIHFRIEVANFNARDRSVVHGSQAQIELHHPNSDAEHTHALSPTQRPIFNKVGKL